ncbi:MFS transporter [Streptomyces sp. NBC_01515]|uniref:MFS transporter n=1 Tax=Streptomyces sp. NBC_01515 TaxID=2903890 RepID=UPI00386359CB
MSSGTVTPPVGRSLALLGVVLVAAQSFQLVVFPNFLKSLLAEPGWHLSPSDAGLIGSMVYLGMPAGAAAAGPLARRLGRRNATLAAVLWLTLWSGACAVAVIPWQLGFLRMLAGIGMGVAMPLILSFAKDATTRSKRALGTVLFGMPAAAIIAQSIVTRLPVEGAWRLLTAVGAGVGIIALALSLWLLPGGTGMSGLAGHEAGHLNPIPRMAMWTGIGLIGANLIAWSGLTGLTSTDLRFNAVLNAGAFIAIFAAAGLAIHRTETPTSLSGTVRATAAFVLIYPPTFITILITVLNLVAPGDNTAFVLMLIGVWIVDGYCRALALSVAPGVFEALPRPKAQADGHIAPVPQPLRPGSEG